MEKYSNAEIDLFSIMILMVLFRNVHTRKEDCLPDQKLFNYMIIANAAILFVDAIQWVIDGIDYPWLRVVNVILSMFFFMLQTVPSTCWCLYVRYKYTMNLKETMRIKWVLLIPAAFIAVMSVLSCFNGAFFFIDMDNVYHRGELFPVFIAIIACYFAYALIYIFINRNRIEKRIYRSLLIFALPPLVGGSIQAAYYGTSLEWPCVTLSILIIFMNIQNSQLYTDHLTGINNRKLLDIYLNRYLKKTDQASSIGAIMIDIDNFKSINDRFGHTTGDQALIDAAMIIKKSVGKDRFLARYGGDEFVIILDAEELTQIEDLVNTIERNVERYNRKESTPFRISLSLGYALFKCGTGLSSDSVLNSIDHIMYENKRCKLAGKII